MTNLYSAQWFAQYGVTNEMHRHILTGVIQTALYKQVMQGHDIAKFKPKDTDTIMFDERGMLQQASRTADFLRYLTREQGGFSLLTVCRTILPIADGTEPRFLTELGGMFFESRNTVASVFGKDKRYVQMKRIDDWCKALPPVFCSVVRTDDLTLVMVLEEDE